MNNIIRFPVDPLKEFRLNTRKESYFISKMFQDTELAKTIKEIARSQELFIDVTQQYKQRENYYMMVNHNCCFLDSEGKKFCIPIKHAKGVKCEACGEVV